MTLPKDYIIKILYLEDDPDDVTLFKRSLKNSSILHKVNAVSNKEEFLAEDVSKYDIVVSDYNLKNYDGLSAIQHVKNENPVLPIILLSGTVGEEMAVDLLHAGATDFVLKENIKKIPPAINRAVSQAAVQKEKQRFQKELVEKNLILDTIFDSFQDLVFLKDVEGRYVRVNQAFCKFQRMHQAEIIGKTEHDLFASELAREAVEKDDYVKLSGNPISYEVEMMHDGKRLVLEGTKTPVLNEGRVKGIVGQFKDITSHKKLLDETLKSRSILAQAEKITKSGSFEYDLDKDLIICSSNFKYLMRLNIEGDTISLKKFTDLIKPEDREIFQEGITKALDNNEEYFGEHRFEIKNNGNSAKYCRIVFRPDYKDDHGIRFYGTVVDVTVEYETEVYMMKKQEQDRKELARELHDNLGQKMNGISMFISKISDDLPDNKDLVKVKNLVHESIDDLSFLISSISTKQIEEHSLDYAIDKLISFIPESIKVKRKFDIEESNITPYIKSQIFRIIQESLNNITKYSKASKVKCELTQTGSVLDLLVEDNGVGFEVEKVLNGNGLQNITHRVRRSNGLINIDSEKGKGTRLTAKIPIN